MRSKHEQLERAKEIIMQQGLELIEKYGWDKKEVEETASKLLIHAKSEIESSGDFEDLSQCWNLAGFATGLSWCIKGKYENENKSDTVRHVIFKFDYIQDTPVKDLEVYLTNEDGNDMVILGDKETKIGMKVSAEDIVNKVDKFGEYEAAKALYNLFCSHVVEKVS